MKDISVIICAYTEERWDDLVAAVESLRQQETLPDEIIVVIDHNDHLLERVRTSISGVITIENTEQRGLSGGRNSGIAVSRGKFIAFLDDDAVAEPGWLTLLSRWFENPDVLGVGGAVIPLWLGKRPGWFPQEFYWVIGCSYLGLPKKLSIVRNPFGGCSCYRREVFELIGGFRQGIGRADKRPMGGEETELCIRVRQQLPQKVFLYDPQARIHHRIPPRRATWSYLGSRCYSEGVSKALIGSYVGTKDSLASERSYTLRTLPLGVLRGLLSGLIHLDMVSIMRAIAIVYGFAMTITGYTIETISQHFSSKEASDSASNQLLQVSN